MAIKIRGRDLKKRMYNGMEVQKVMYNGIQIWPDGWIWDLWEPTENTIAYWPLTSATKNLDQWWYHRNLTAHNMAYGPEYAIFPDDNVWANYLEIADIQFNEWDSFFISVWALAWKTPAESGPRIIGNGSGDRWVWIAVNRQNEYVTYWEPAVTGGSVNLDIPGVWVWDYQRIYYYYTWIMGWVCRWWFINPQGEHHYWTGTAKLMPAWFTIWTNGNPEWRTYDSWRWLMWEIIIENKVWGITDCVNYYNQRKYIYWL